MVMTPLVLLMCTLHIPINRNKEPRYSCIFTGIHLILINSRLQITISMCDAPFISYDQLGCFLCQIKQCSLVDLCLSSHCISTRKWSDIVKKVVVNHRSDTLVYRQFFFYQRIPSQRETAGGTFRSKALILAVESQPILLQPPPSTP